MRSIPSRTATSILSMANRRIGDRADTREKYLRLANLEFEKTSRAARLRKAMELAGECEERLAEIAREQGYLLRTAAATRNGEPMPSQVPPRTKRAAGAGPVGRLAF